MRRTPHGLRAEIRIALAAEKTEELMSVVLHKFI